MEEVSEMEDLAEVTFFDQTMLNRVFVYGQLRADRQDLLYCNVR